MRTILKAKWAIMAVWAALVVLLVVTAPSMAVLVREKGGISLPDGYPSTLATQMEERHQTKAEDELSLVLVFHNPEGLTAKDKEETGKAVQLLKASADKLGITGVMSPADSKELEAQMVAKDNKTTLAMINVKANGRDTAEMRQELSEPLAELSVAHYYTGSMLVDEDVVISSEKGLQRTELITVFFILIVLVLVFRSVVAPIIPLFTVGITYVASQSIVAFLIDRLNFPVSNFTQIFLVAVLFGIGTDYCILLLSRFKEEMAKNPGQIREAIVRTYTTAGKTVLFSGLAAMVGFASIGLASFKLYQSASAVAIGVTVLLVALFTIVPFFMAVLGPKLFWPSKGSLEHKESRMWAATGNFSLKKPWAALLFTAVIVVPLLLSYKGNLSFNSLNEIGDSYDSVKGFNIISDSFGPGEAMTTKVVLESEKPLDNEEAYAVIEKVTRELVRTPGVAKVRSLTRPLGEEMEQFAVASQAKTLGDGLGQGSDGLESIKSGLAQASQSLTGSAPELAKATDGIQELVNGTNRLKDGVGELQAGLVRIEEGVRSGATGAGGLKDGLTELQKNADLLSTSGRQLLTAYQALHGGLKELSAYYGAVETGLKQSAEALTGLQASFAAIAGKYPEVAKEPDYLKIKATVTQTAGELSGLESGLSQLSVQLAKAQEGLAQANQGLSQAVDGQTALSGGMTQLQAGAEALAGGLTAAANGQNQAISGLPAIQTGLGQLAEGQTSLLNGFSSLGGQLQQLTDGLGQSVGGLGQVQDGLVSARSYLDDLSSAPDKETSGWFLPKQAAEDAQFQQVITTYLSQDKKLASFEIVLSNNPYDTEALASIDGIRDAAEKAIQGTSMQDAKIGVNGVSSIYNDLQNMSNADYKRTVLLMMGGITLILIVLLRSLIMPVYLMVSLVLCYFTSLAINEVIFVYIMGYSGTNWAIPFFGFVMLMALGVDYSIFLMDRFNEHKDEPVDVAILTAMKNMGTVIVSAVIILAGTFAAMYPSGVLSLLQIATVVLAGLIIYALVFLQFFVPVMVRLFGRANWWPFMPKKQENNGHTMKG
jgi:putative drug exporter of the RND superfamily